MAGFVDAHAHLWSSAVAEASWLRSPETGALRRPFGADEFGRASADVPVGAAIAVVAGETLDETRWLLGESNRSTLFSGVVGWVDVDGEPGAQLDDLDAAAASVPLVGIRHPATGDSTVLVSGAMSRLLAELGRRGLTFDLLIRASGMADAIACVRAHPETLFVLDHLGNPPADEGERREWADALDELGRSANVRAKISGLTVVHRSASVIGHVVDVALAAFGPDRLMLGSDWPVCTLATGYETTAGSYLAAIAGLTAAEQADIRCGTAMRTYEGSYERAG